MLGVVVAGILEHLDGPLDFLSVLVTIKDLFSQRDLPISDPIDELFKQMTKLTESMKTGEDFHDLACRVNKMIEDTSRACFYFLHVIEPLWAQSRGLAV